MAAIHPKFSPRAPFSAPGLSLSFMARKVSPSFLSPAAPPTSPNLYQRRIVRDMLSNYISAIQEDDYLLRLNEVLKSRFDDAATKDLRSYYASRPELKNYTLGVEMDRMDYRLISEDGRAIDDKHAIRSFFCADENRGQSTGQELLIRAANQSLLADALEALIGSETTLLGLGKAQQTKIADKLVLAGPRLSMAAVAEKCDFTIDLKQGSVEAVCILSITVPFEQRRLVLARAILTACFQPGNEKGQFRYAIQRVEACHSPQSETLSDAAALLARDREAAKSQSKHNGGGIRGDTKLYSPFVLGEVPVFKMNMSMPAYNTQIKDFLDRASSFCEKQGIRGDTKFYSPFVLGEAPVFKMDRACLPTTKDTGQTTVVRTYGVRAPECSNLWKVRRFVLPSIAPAMRIFMYGYA